MKSYRPSVMSTRFSVVSGHYLSAQAGLNVLQQGGNAFDAGVAVGLATNVLESQMTGFGGVAPAMMYFSDSGEVMNFVGVGPWPRRLSTEYFWRHHAGRVPAGILNTVVPAAPDIWLSVLERFGSMSFAEVSEAAISLARDGFPMYPFMVETLASHLDDFSHLDETAAIFLPQGALPKVGQVFKQTDLAGTLQYLVDEERAAGGSRVNGLEAARRAFYDGDIATEIIAQQEREGGLMSREDLREFRAELESPVKVSFRDVELYGCGPWSQGPMILQAAKLLEAEGLDELAHNGVDYVHRVVEALKLAAADREHYFGDPRHIEVPLHELLSPRYLQQRGQALNRDIAAKAMPAPGLVTGLEIEPWQPDPSAAPDPVFGAPSAQASTTLETSYFCVIDERGNMFSATPSDPTISGRVVPGTGITTSMWGSRAHTGKDHPARVGPGWRPRMSANPMLVVQPNKRVIPIGSPGSEVLGQAQLQVLLNQLVFEMDPQSAVEAPRFASYSWPASALPHSYHPARLLLEAEFDDDVVGALAQRGHDIKRWPSRAWQAGSVCTIVSDLASGVRGAGADPRRTAYAVGW